MVRIIYSYCTFLLLLFCMNAYSSDFEQRLEQKTIETIGKINCSKYEDIFSQCFSMTKDQCLSMYSSVISTCKNEVDQFPDSLDNTEDSEIFKNCMNEELHTHISNRGVDLEEQCTIDSDLNQ